MAWFFRHRLPWVSLLLLFCSYTFIGKLLTYEAYSQEADWFLVGGSFAIAVIYVHPMSELGQFMRRWFSSDTIAFSAFLMFAAATSIFLYWFKVLQPIMLMLFSTGLARLDLQAIGYSRWQTLLQLVIFTALGLGCGWWLGQ
jgi:hypothetical protein